MNLTVFQSSFLLFVTFDTMLWVRYLFDVKLLIGLFKENHYKRQVYVAS